MHIDAFLRLYTLHDSYWEAMHTISGHRHETVDRPKSQCFPKERVSGLFGGRVAENPVLREQLA